MSSAMPTDQRLAYQRWELASFDPPPPDPVDHQQQIDVEALLAEAREQIAAAREDARREGLAEGLAQGYQAGMDQARARAIEENAMLQTLSHAFSAELVHAKDLVAQDMLDLALDLAKAMLKTVLAVQPEHILPVVSEAIGYLPSVQQPAILFLHPEDAVLVQDRMSSELPDGVWRIVEDATLERGGCRLETGTNQVDATTPARWQRITNSLGRENPWLP